MEKPRKTRPATIEEPHLVRRVLTAKEFGQCIGVSESTVHRMIAAREVQYIENPRGGRRIPVEEVDAYLRRHLRREKSPTAPTPPKGSPSPPPRRDSVADSEEGCAASPDGVRRLRFRRG